MDKLTVDDPFISKPVQSINSSVFTRFLQELKSYFDSSATINASAFVSLFVEIDELLFTEEGISLIVGSDLSDLSKVYV
jgi:hypothetical protein